MFWYIYFTSSQKTILILFIDLIFPHKFTAIRFYEFDKVPDIKPTALYFLDKHIFVSKFLCWK